MVKPGKAVVHSIALSSTLTCTAVANAAEGFEPRYNLAGSLGGEMFAPAAQAGWAGGIAATHISIGKVTGNDGKRLQMDAPGGTVPLPAPVPSALYPSYRGNAATIDGTGTMTRLDMALVHVTPEHFAGGRLLFGFDLPFARKTQSVAVNGATPAVNWSPAFPPAARGAVEAQFGALYQDSLAAQGTSQSGEISGIGDAELLAGWQYVSDQLRVLSGASLILPTGKYSAASGPDIGAGNFYTLRPSIQVAYLPTPEVGLAGKLSVGLNSRNKDNDLRSGNWVGLEAAAGYKTAVGVLGLHAVHVQQYQDDDNNPLGASRFRSTNAGAFFTTIVPGIDAPLTMQYMTTTASRNAKHGSFTQLRLIKFF
jgi:hypothetical protein